MQINQAARLLILLVQFRNNHVIVIRMWWDCNPWPVIRLRFIITEGKRSVCMAEVAHRLSVDTHQSLEEEEYQHIFSSQLADRNMGWFMVKTQQWLRLWLSFILIKSQCCSSVILSFTMQFIPWTSDTGGPDLISFAEVGINEVQNNSTTEWLQTKQRPIQSPDPNTNSVFKRSQTSSRGCDSIHLYHKLDTQAHSVFAYSWTDESRCGCWF